jgi:hypothetical protein
MCSAWYITHYLNQSAYAVRIEPRNQAPHTTSRVVQVIENFRIHFISKPVLQQARHHDYYPPTTFHYYLKGNWFTKRLALCNPTSVVMIGATDTHPGIDYSYCILYLGTLAQIAQRVVL